MDSPSPKSGRASSFYKSLRHAIEGLLYSLETQRNMRIHFIAGLAVIGLGVFFRLNPLELALLILAVSFVILAEMINTAIENVVDITTRRRIHPLAKVSKDLAAAAVLVAALCAVAVGLILFVPKLLLLIGISQ